MCEAYQVVWTQRDRNQHDEAIGKIEVFEPDGVTPVPGESPMGVPEDTGLVTEGEAALFAEARGATVRFQ